jgi:hypothetical protein
VGGDSGRALFRSILCIYLSIHAYIYMHIYNIIYNVYNICLLHTISLCVRGGGEREFKLALDGVGCDLDRALSALCVRVCACVRVRVCVGGGGGRVTFVFHSTRTHGVCVCICEYVWVPCKNIQKNIYK